MCSKRVVLSVVFLSLSLVFGAATSITAQDDWEITVDDGNLLPGDTEIFLPVIALGGSDAEVLQQTVDQSQVHASGVGTCSRNIVQNGSFTGSVRPWKCHNCTLIGFGGVIYARIKAVDYSNGKYIYPSNVQVYQSGITISEPEYEVWLLANSKYGEDIGLFVHKHDQPYTMYLTLKENKYDPPNALPLENWFFPKPERSITIETSTGGNRTFTDYRTNNLVNYREICDDSGSCMKMYHAKQSTPGDGRVRLWLAPYLKDTNAPVTYIALDEICIQPR